MATVSRMVLTNPRMRETRVPAAMIALERASLRATYVSPVSAGDLLLLVFGALFNGCLELGGDVFARATGNVLLVGE